MRYDLQPGAWSPLRCSQAAAAEQLVQLFHHDQFTLNFTLGPSEVSPANLSQSRGLWTPWVEWVWAEPRDILFPFMLLVPVAVSQSIWEMACFNPFKMQFLETLKSLFQFSLEQNLKRHIFYIQVGAICCLKETTLGCLYYLKFINNVLLQTCNRCKRSLTKALWSVAVNIKCWVKRVTVFRFQCKPLNDRHKLNL